MQFEVRNRFTGEVQFTAEIECAEDASRSIKLGLAVRLAIKSGADLSGAKDAALVIARTRILPEGELIVWKKLSGGVIAKLRIPAEAKRSHAFGRKCRAEFADVIEGEGVSQYDSKTKYTPVTFRKAKRTSWNMSRA